MEYGKRKGNMNSTNSEIDSPAWNYLILSSIAFAVITISVKILTHTKKRRLLINIAYGVQIAKVDLHLDSKLCTWKLSFHNE